MPYRFQLLKFVYRVFLSLTLVAIASPLASAQALRSGFLPEDIESILTDYSQYLVNGTTPHRSLYSSQILTLIEERREYYREFFEKGLHSNLDSIDAQFVIDDTANFSQKADTYNLKLTEIITMNGRPINTRAEEYPLIQAAKWAWAQANNPHVRIALEEYITNTKDAFDESVLNEVQIVFVLRHNIEMRAKKRQLQIVSDEFTEQI